MHKDIALPVANFDAEVQAGGIKKVKSEHRRSDAMFWMEPSKLSVLPGFNVRVRDAGYEAHIRGLADSMKADGFAIDKPISCFVRKQADGEDAICIVGGHSRHEAALLAISEGASFDTIPVVFVSKAMSVADMTIDLVRGNNGRQLTTYETAIVVKRLSNMDFTDAEIGRKLGFTSTHIASMILLASAPHPLAKLVIAGEVSASTAIETIRKHGPAKALEMLKTAVAGAQKEGKTRITAASLPGASFTKAVKKSASQLFEHVVAVQADPAYGKLAEETRTQLDALLADLKAKQPEPQPEALAA